MSRSRGKVLCDKRVQGALAKRVLFHWAIFFLLSVLCLLALECFLGEPSLGLGGHLGVIWQKYGFFFLLMMAIIPSFIYDTLKLSNRFAGPMVRLKESIRQVADGQPAQPIKFRDGDFWSDVSDEFNRMVQRIDEQKRTS